MALNHSPKIVTDGLVFAYDMANTKKSWKGMPTTNQFTLPTSDVNGFGVQNSTFTRIRTGNYGGYEITPTDYVWRYNVTGNDCPYHGWDIPTTAGAVVTFSFDYYVDPSTTNYPVTNYLANFENAGSGVGGSIGDPTPSIKGVWKRAYFSSTATATGNSRCLLYPGACGGRLGDAGFILYKNPQVEFNAPGSIPTPFVAGTRSNTQALVDLTGRSTATVSALTYNSDNTFEFNYANSAHVSVPLSTAFNKTTGTMNFWVYPTRYNGGNGYFVNREDATPNATDWFWIGPYSNTFYFRLGNGSDCCSNDLSFGDVASVIPLNTWTNMCFTWVANGTSAIYKNGTLYTSRTIGNVPATNPASNGRIGLGHDNADNYFHGKMSNVSIYNRALTAVEVKQNFNAIRRRYGV